VGSQKVGVFANAAWRAKPSLPEQDRENDDGPDTAAWQIYTVLIRGC
jgi:hypothetical protein